MALLVIWGQKAIWLEHSQLYRNIKPYSPLTRQGKWTQSIAVGDKAFVEQIKKHLGLRAKGRQILKDEDDYQLRDAQTGYADSIQNLFYWDLDRNLSKP